MAYSFTQTTARVLARLARYQPVRSGLQKLAVAYRQQQAMSTASPNHDIAEVLPIDPRPAVAQGGTRLNLMVPAASKPPCKSSMPCGRTLTKRASS